ncbi:hypothetical protein [Nocardia abscessus]|uniref:hypothetical protein n=1 Tax=Nocardia abscessus TaxID=120957 RepID=UPI0024571E4C|nr:hypothetical protein [Nocardia abscessus]
MNEALEALRPVIRRAARSVAYQWPEVADADDIEQGIYLRLLESPGSVEKINEMEDAARYRAVVGIGHQLASEERDDYSHFSGNFAYSVDDVKSLLQRGVLSYPVSGFDSAVVDLRIAMDRLDDVAVDYAASIRSRYLWWEIPTRSTEKTTLSRALTALADEMNRSNRKRFAEHHDGPGSRTVVSNAAAKAATS